MSFFWERLKAILWPAALRALRTFLQTFASFLTIEGCVLQSFEDVNWAMAVGASSLAALYSFIMSFATGLPEVDIDTSKR